MIISKILEDRAVSIDAIVHVGAHTGQEFETYATLGAKIVLLIEADPLVFQHLIRNVLIASSRYLTVPFFYNGLVGEVDGEMFDFWIYNNAGQSSSIYRSTDLLKQAWKGLSETGESISLPSLRLPTILTNLRFSLNDNAILVLDIQGSELNALRGSQSILRTFRYIEIEVSVDTIYDGGPLFPEIDMLMQKSGFRRITDIPWHGDVVYERINSAAC